MVGRGLPTPAPATEPNVTVARNRPTEETAPRRGDVHDVERVVTHEQEGAARLAGFVAA